MIDNWITFVLHTVVSVALLALVAAAERTITHLRQSKDRSSSRGGNVIGSYLLIQHEARVSTDTLSRGWDWKGPLDPDCLMSLWVDISSNKEFILVINKHWGFSSLLALVVVFLLLQTVMNLWIITCVSWDLCTNNFYSASGLMYECNVHIQLHAQWTSRHLVSPLCRLYFQMFRLFIAYLFYL